jgi:hypothetical protein
MSAPDDAIARAVDATAVLIGLPLAPEHRPGVLAFFALAAQMAELVEGLPLSVHDESGAVFEPLAPGAPR